MVRFGSDSRYTANVVAEHVVDGAGSQRDGTLGCKGVEQGNTGDATTLSRAVWLGSTCSRHDEETDDKCVGLRLKQGVFQA